MSTPTSPPPPTTNTSATPTGITRAGKACEPCRLRKTRCNIARQAICSECVKRDIAGECKIREKARPNRPVSQKVRGTSGARASSPTFPSTSASPAPDGMFPFDNSTSYPSGEDLRVEDYGAERQSVPAPISATNAQAGPSTLGWSAPLTLRPIPPAAQPPSHHQTVPPPRSGSTSATAIVESLLESQAKERYGLDISASLPPENIFKSRHSRYLTLQEIGLDPSLPSALAQAQGWINTHFRAIHHGTPFLHLPQVLDIASRLFHPSPSTTPSIASDELALLYAVLSLGSLREQTYDAESGSYRTLPTTTMSIDDLLLGFGASPLSDTASGSPGSIAQSLFRLAQEELEQLEQPSETAVQALFLLHMFVCNTSMGRRSRDYVARAVMMSHELGLNRRSVGQGGDEHGLRRRAMLYLYVYFSDVYLSALESHPPLIKRHDFDPDVFQPITLAQTDVDVLPSGTPLAGLRDFVDLVSTIGGALERLHGGYHSDATSSVQLVLELDGEMDNLRSRLGKATFDPDLRPGAGLSADRRSAMAGSVLRQIHYNWYVFLLGRADHRSRISLRGPSLRHPLLGHSSLAICARSALSILPFYRHVITSGLLNLPWMQLRRIATSIYLIFLALWAGEVTYADAEAAVGHTLALLCVVGTRWKSATGLARTVVQLADASGLVFDKPQEEVSTDAVLRLDGAGFSWDGLLGPLGLNGNGMPESGLNLSGDPTLDWASLGANADMFANWQTLHQPPW